MKFESLNCSEKKALYSELMKKYGEYVERKLSLDLSRGKPNAEQLDISQELLSYPITKEDCFEGGVDYRNYGILDGIPSVKKLFSEMLDIKANYISVGGNTYFVC